jgi:hypothetical protein
MGSIKWDSESNGNQCPNIFCLCCCAPHQRTKYVKAATPLMGGTEFAGCIFDEYST